MGVHLIPKGLTNIPAEHRPLPGRLNVVLTHSGSFDIATAENVIKCGNICTALDLLASSPYCLSIENVFVIGGGQREALNAPRCDAIHVTEIETLVAFDTFLPMDVLQWISASEYCMIFNCRRCTVRWHSKEDRTETEAVQSAQNLPSFNNSGMLLQVGLPLRYLVLVKVIYEKWKAFILKSSD
ncbi:hypothetical protein NL676_038505 [Syzygium grande]|nr:hypothetical protein NL676_038505 [Syzygium grande]